MSEIELPLPEPSSISFQFYTAKNEAETSQNSTFMLTKTAVNFILSASRLQQALYLRCSTDSENGKGRSSSHGLHNAKV